ncbi:hypothetical protein VWZ82_13090 [Phaeobacter sp. JH20_41]|uniref:hypothetical protein n=1 Tax=Phaeobacter sp. JH20_41 TaxID=3112498 RepID=UPI003A8AE861
MKYVVTMRVETKAALVIEADNEEHARDEAMKIAKAGGEETLDAFVDPRDFVEFDWSSDVDEIQTAESVGWDKPNVRAVNVPLAPLNT